MNPESAVPEPQAVRRCSHAYVMSGVESEIFALLARKHVSAHGQLRIVKSGQMAQSLASLTTHFEALANCLIFFSTSTDAVWAWCPGHR